MGSQVSGAEALNVSPDLAVFPQVCMLPSPSTATLATEGQEEHVLVRKITEGVNLQAGCLQRSRLPPTCHLCHHHPLRLFPCLIIPSGLRPLSPSQLITSSSFCNPSPVAEGCYWAGETLMGSGHILGHLLWQSGRPQRSGLLLICCLCKCPA